MYVPVRLFLYSPLAVIQSRSLIQFTHIYLLTYCRIVYLQLFVILDSILPILVLVYILHFYCLDISVSIYFVQQQ